MQLRKTARISSALTTNEICLHLHIAAYLLFLYWSYWRLLLVEDHHSPLHVMVMHCFRLAAYRLLSLLHKSRCQSSCRCFILDIYYLCRSRFCLCAVPRPPDSINILTTLPTALRRTVLYKEPRFIRTAPPLFCLPRPHPPSCVRFLRETVPNTRRLPPPAEPSMFLRANVSGFCADFNQAAASGGCRPSRRDRSRRERREENMQ